MAKIRVGIHSKIGFEHSVTEVFE